MSRSDRGDFSRRYFLQAFGTVAGLAVALPLPAGAGDFLEPAFSGALRVGVAMPGFGRDEQRAQAWLEGLKLALGEAEIEIAAAGPYAAQLRQASIDLLRRKVQVIIGAIVPTRARQLVPLLSGAEVPFLNVEPGAHIVRPDDRHPLLFHHTLQAWQASYATGAAAARRFGPRAVAVASFRESGYDTLTAFGLGLESAGGQVTERLVSGVPGGGPEVAECLRSAKDLRPDFIYTGGIAEIAGAVPSPMSDTAGAPDPGFAGHYARATGHKADAYALLGFEAGSLLAEAARQARARHRSLRSGLAGAAIEGPRGRVRMNAATQTTEAAAYVNAAGAVLSGLQPIDEAAVLEHPAWHLARSGWAVPYAA